MQPHPTPTPTPTTDRTTIRIFDTTLRDGEQSPGASLNHHEKLEIARQLEALGVDVIEAGFPITSQGDFDAVKAIGQALEHTTVAGLCRCVDRDIDRAGQALEGVHHPRIHVLGAGSKIHLEQKMRKTRAQMIEMTQHSICHARTYADDIEYSPEDGARTEMSFLVELTQAAIEAGGTTINIPDTVGFAVPEEYGRIFSYVREQLPVIDERGIILSAHCHNDLGLAVANSLAAVQHGAKQVECTVNGIGERAGNAALEEIVMALRTRGGDDDYFRQYQSAINPRKIFPTSRMVSNLTGLQVQRNKAIIGENAFAHEAGIHQDGMIKNRSTYEIMDPTELGVPQSKLVLGKHSGRHALGQRVEQMGYSLDKKMLDRVYEQFKTLADKKKDVYDEDIEAILDQQFETERKAWELVRFQITSGTGVISTATVVLRDSATGDQSMDASTGDGPIDACYAAITRITGIQVELEQYQTRAVTGGRDAQGEVVVQVRQPQRVAGAESAKPRLTGASAVASETPPQPPTDTPSARGRGYSTDVVEAAVHAYLSALNRLQASQARSDSIVGESSISQP